MFNKLKIFLVILLMSFPAHSIPLSSLQELIWSNRMILIFSNQHDSQKFRVKLENATTDIDDRQIIWFISDDQQLFSNYPGQLNSQFHGHLVKQWKNKNSNTPQVILIGKDGGEKSGQNTLDLDEIFFMIDQMPMRVQEMRSPEEK